MGIYNRVKHYSLGKPYWDIDVIPPSPDEDNYSYKFVIDTEVYISGNTQYEIPTFFTTDGLINVNWGDNNIDRNVSTQITHTYSSPGIYTIKLYPNLGHKITQIRHYNLGGSVDINSARQVIEFIDWGDNISDWNSMLYHFRECENLSGFTSNIPNLTNVNSFRLMFFDCNYFNTDISSWDVSNVNDMFGVFFNAENFNQDISSWDVSNVNTMRGMFNNATSFNQDISSWNTSNVNDMSSMFRLATSFNQDISSWNTSNVNDMSYMFNFNSSFNQDLGSWNISSLTDASFMFDNSNLSTTNYDNLLIGWAAQAPNIRTSVNLGAAGINRTAASLSAYNTLTTTYNWTITDAGLI